MTARLQQLHHWLSQTIGNKDYDLQPASGDASFRRYYRLTQNNETFIVMDAPPEQEDCASFIDIAGRLHDASINVPKIIAKDLRQGFLLLSDLGDEQYLHKLTQADIADTSVNVLYEEAMQALLRIQQQADDKGLPTYDEKLLRQEMELFRHWLLQEHVGLKLTKLSQAMLDDLFTLLVKEALSQPQVFVHRDYHSRNLMIFHDKDSHDRKNNPGVLDFQDAVLGPITYDLVSLLKDCYIKWPRQQTRDWVMTFFLQLAKDHPELDERKFMRWFDLMGVQRHLKASGIFARLYHRDGKPGYLADIPRTLSYIVDLKDDYPELQALVELIQNQVMTADVMISVTEADQPCVP